MSQRRPNLSGKPTRPPGPNGAGPGMGQVLQTGVTILPNGKVGVSAVPFSYEIGKVQTNDGSELVVLKFLLPTGQTVLMMPKEFAKGLARMLDEAGTGLTVAQADQVPGLIMPPQSDGA